MATPPKAPSVTGSSAGFTLMELCVVMAIMAVMLGAGAFLLQDNREAYLLRRESARLREVLGMAATDAVVHGREWALIPGSAGYRFVYFDDDAQQWTVPADAVFADHPLASPLQFTTQLGDQLALPSPMDGIAQNPSAILLLSSGQTSKFALTLQGKTNDKMRFTVSGDGRSGIGTSEVTDDKK